MIILSTSSFPVISFQKTSSFPFFPLYILFLEIFFLKNGRSACISNKTRRDLEPIPVTFVKTENILLCWKLTKVHIQYFRKLNVALGLHSVKLEVIEDDKDCEVEFLFKFLLMRNLRNCNFNDRFHG